MGSPRAPGPVRLMPSASRTGLRAPSAATRYRTWSRLFRAAAAVQQPYRHVPLGLREAGQFGAEPDPGPGVLRGRAEHGLEQVLGDQAGPFRAGLDGRASRASGLPQRKLPRFRQGAAGRHVVVPGQVTGGRVHRGGQPELAEDLHAAHVQAARLGLG